MVNVTSRQFYRRQTMPVPTEQEAGWAPEPISTIWKRYKFLVPTGIRTLDRPAHSLVANTD